jgi:hypothetical protein
MPASAGRPPHSAYAAIAATFLGGLALAGGLARALDREPREHNGLDVLVLGAATFKIARTITRDEVTSFLRDPFVVGESHEGEGEEPVATGDIRQAIGELVTCSRCIGTWVAGGLTATQVLAPRFGRLVALTFAVGALNDWLQAGFQALTKTANLIEERAELESEPD